MCALAIRQPMAEPAGPAHLGGGDRCFTYDLEFGMMGLKNNKHSGKRHLGEMQKDTWVKCKI